MACAQRCQCAIVAYGLWAWQREHTQERPADADAIQTARSRRAMLMKVRIMWIDNMLTHSLYQEVLLALGLSERATAVQRPLDLLVRQPDQPDQPLPSDTRILDVFDRMDDAPLILGAPGAGKTTIQLDLARDLFDHAQADPAHPIPVVFPLASAAAQSLDQTGTRAGPASFFYSPCSCLCNIDSALPRAILLPMNTQRV